MATSMFEILDGSSWVPMYRVVTSDLKFRMNISNRHSQSDFTHSFDFYCPTNFVNGIDLLCKASLWCGLLRKHPIFTLKSNKFIPLWWAKFELECLLKIFTYFNSKFKVTCNNEDFLIFFSSKFFNLPSWVVWSILFVIKAFQNGSFLPK